jgi:hypothetical protein
MELPDELATMDIPRYRMGREWMAEYHRHIEISAPKVGFLSTE